LIVDPKDETRSTNLTAPDREQRWRRKFQQHFRGAHVTFTTSGLILTNTDHLITGDDGGVWYSYDGGNAGGKAITCNLTQFYHVSVDMDMPIASTAAFRTTVRGWATRNIPAA